MILVIDNYDSFTYNLVQYLGELGVEQTVVRNDQVTIDEIKEMHPDKIVISPGPCTPSEAGICLDVIREFHKGVPILGVCLGHQAIGEALGGRVVKAAEIIHGKTSDIFHRGEGSSRTFRLPSLLPGIIRSSWKGKRFHSVLK